MINLITEHMDTWTAAQAPNVNIGRGRGNYGNGQIPHGIKKLRELILELAVRGRLVPQDPNDEPASKLLLRIAKEKKRLIKERKIKKGKPLPEIEVEKRLFNLPQGWEWTRLEYLSADIHYGYTASANPLSKKVRLLRITDIQNDLVDWDTVPGCEIDDKKVCNYELENGDILIARTGGTIGKSYLVEDIKLCSVFASYLIRVKRITGMYPQYIKTFLGSQIYWGQLYENSMGTGQPNVNGNALKRLAIPLPPLPEQHRIVAKANELMNLCDKLEQQQFDSNNIHQTLVETLLAAITSTADPKEFAITWQRITDHFDTLFTTEPSIDQLKQTILQLAVMGKLVPQDPNDEPASVLLEKITKEKKRFIKEGKIKKGKPLPEIGEDEIPFQMPVGWEGARCQDFCYKITDGEHATPRRADSGFYLLSARNVTDKGILLHDVDFVPKDEFKRIRKRCDPNIGDILISCSGSIGRVALVDRDEAYAMVRSAAMIRLDNKLLSKEFIAFALRSPYLQEQMVGRSRKSAQANLFLGAISMLVFAIPPLFEQNRIVAKVVELIAICDELKVRLNEAQKIQYNLADAIVSKISGLPPRSFNLAS